MDPTPEARDLYSSYDFKKTRRIRKRSRFLKWLTFTTEILGEWEDRVKTERCLCTLFDNFLFFIFPKIMNMSDRSYLSTILFQMH